MYLIQQMFWVVAALEQYILGNLMINIMNLKELPQKHCAKIQVTKRKYRFQKVNSDRNLKQAFISQIKSLKKIISPNIVGFKEVLQTDNNYYIVQEYCDGGDLDGLLKKRKILPQEEAIKFMIQILTGFFDIMRCGIVHRDLKPSNVLISKGKLKIADFGLARPSSQSMLSQVGTPAYQSPQLLIGQPYSNKCDIWAIGLVFYQMLYGKLPWDCNISKKNYHNQIMTKKLVFPSQNVVSQEVKQFISNCLCRQENGRTNWPQIFRNDIWKNRLPNYQILDQIFSYTINQIMKNIQAQCWDLKKIYLKFNSNSTQKGMTRKDMYLMIKKLAPNVKKYHMDFVISKFDRNSDGLIDFQQFTKTLNTGRQIKTILSEEQIKTVIFRWAQYQKEQFLQKCKEQWRELKQRISKRFAQNERSGDQQGYSLFQRHSSKKIDNKKKRLNQEQFSQLLKEIDPALTQKQCYFLFRSFDKDGDNQITMTEFLNYFPKLINLEEQDPQHLN